MAVEERALEVRGMDCTGCETTIGKVLTQVDGVLAADPDHQADRVEVRFDADRVSEEDIKAKIRDAGYEVD